MMDNARERKAWHVAGHAYTAIGFGFTVEMLSIVGFTQADLDNAAGAKRIDEGTMIHLPVCHHAVGKYEHTKIMENLMYVALCGPIAELYHYDQPCTLATVQQYAVDWAQAWESAGFNWSNEEIRLKYLERQIPLGETYTSHTLAYETLVPISKHLLEFGTMNAAQIQAVTDQVKETKEKMATQRIRLPKQTINFDHCNEQADDWHPVFGSSWSKNSYRKRD